MTSSMNLARLDALCLSELQGCVLFKKILEFLRDLLSYSVHDLGHSSRHGISRSIPIRASDTDNLVIWEAFDIAECSIAF